MIRRRELLLGVELAPSSLRLVEARLDGNQISVERSLNVAMPAAAYRDGQLLAPKEAGLALKLALKEQFKPRTRRAVVSVGGQTALVRRILLPRMSRRRLIGLIEEQGDQWVPFQREGANFDLQIINPRSGEHEQEVLLTAIPKRYTYNVSTLLKTAGLHLEGIEIDVLAQYRAGVALTGTEPVPGIAAVLDLDRSPVRLGLLENGALLAIRSLDVSGGTDDENSGVTRFSEQLLTEIRRSLELMLTQRGATAQAERLLVCASGVLDSDVAPVLERELRTELQNRLAPSFTVTVVPERLAPQGTSLGLGLCLFRAAAPRSAHLLPRMSVAESRQWMSSVAASLLLLAGTGAYYHFWTGLMPALEGRERQLTQSLASLQGKLAREAEVAAEETIARTLQPLREDLSRSDPWSVAYVNLKQLMPTGVTMTHLTVTPPTITISGVATDPKLIGDFLQALFDSDRFTGIALINTGGDDNRITFQVKADLAPREVGRQ